MGMRENIAKELAAKAEKTKGMLPGKYNFKVNPYTPKGGMESTLHGSEIQKMIIAIKQFGDVIQSLRYLESYFSVEDGCLPEHFSRLIINKQIRKMGHNSFLDADESLENLQKLLNMYVMGLKQGKQAEEVKLIEEENPELMLQARQEIKGIE